MRALKRMIKSGFLNFRRSGATSWAAVLVFTITLFVIATIILLQAVLHSSLDQIKNKVDVTIYFNTGTAEGQILSLESSIQKLPEVDSVTYTSADQALQLFRDRHSDDYSTIQALDEIGSNPLGAYLSIKAKEISQYESIANFMKSDSALSLGSASIVNKIDYYQNKLIISRLDSIIAGANKLGFVLTLLLMIISVIITLNTIRLTIFISKEEIGVMRLVGASKMRVRGPFLVEGVIYGIIATFVTLLLLWPATLWFGNNMTAFLGLNLYEYYISNFLQIMVIILFAGSLLGIFSSYLAVRKYLNR
jgi:cell division transport system permease protein